MLAMGYAAHLSSVDKTKPQQAGVLYLPACKSGIENKRLLLTLLCYINPAR